jgi:Sjoegren syndrome nuclear autoantigen 1
MTERLQRVTESLSKKIAARDDYEKVIQETENSYQKILESTKTLVHVLNRESRSLPQHDFLKNK